MDFDVPALLGVKAVGIRIAPNHVEVMKSTVNSRDQRWSDQQILNVCHSK
jgi:hypothetical protein